MTTSLTASFQAFFNQYIDAFNAHCWEDVKACLSPDVEIYVRGKLDLQHDWERLKKNYMNHWALPNARVDILQLTEFDSGVVVKLLDHARNHLLDITYTYALEDGKWVQIKHEITAVTSATSIAEVQNAAGDDKAV